MYHLICPVPSNVGYSKDTAMMWQQGGQYLPESGIHSGGATQAHSITDKEDDLERDQLIYELNQGFSHGFTQDQVDGKYQNNMGYLVMCKISNFIIYFRNESTTKSVPYPKSSSCNVSRNT